MGEITSAINAKKRLAIKLKDSRERIITYDSIESMFKNELKCNMFNASIAITYNYLSWEKFSFNLECLIRNYPSADFLIDNLDRYFLDYSIRKSDNEKFILLNARLSSAKGYYKVDKICKKIENSNESNKGGFSFLINNIEIDSEKICLFISGKKTLEIKKLCGIEIDNFLNFNFRYYDEIDEMEKKCSADYYELEEFFK